MLNGETRLAFSGNEEEAELLLCCRDEASACGPLLGSDRGEWAMLLGQAALGDSGKGDSVILLRGKPICTQML